MLPAELQPHHTLITPVHTLHQHSTFWQVLRVNSIHDLSPFICPWTIPAVGLVTLVQSHQIPDGAEQLKDWVDREPGSISRDREREIVKQQVGSLFFNLWSLAGLFARSAMRMEYPETQRLVWPV